MFLNNTNIIKSSDFIVQRNLELSKLNKKKINIHDLPMQASMGTIFLIKNDNILSFYSWCDYNHSFSMMVKHIKPTWIGVVNILSPETLNTHRELRHLDDTNIYTPTLFHNIIINLIRSGFDLYTYKC